MTDDILDLKILLNTTKFKSNYSMIPSLLHTVSVTQYKKTKLDSRISDL